MKTAAMILWLLLCTGTGVYEARKLRKRYANLCEAEKGLKTLCDAVRFTRSPFADILAKRFWEDDGFFGKMAHSGCGDMAAAFASACSSGVWQALNREDMDVMKTFFSTAGRVDFETQMGLFSQTLFALGERVKEAEMRKNTHERLYAALGLSAGLFGVLLWL